MGHCIGNEGVKRQTAVSYRNIPLELSILHVSRYFLEVHERCIKANHLTINGCSERLTPHTWRRVSLHGLEGLRYILLSNSVLRASPEQGPPLPNFLPPEARKALAR